jgi:hypothetical protein
VGEEIEMHLMRRERHSLFALPVDAYFPEVNDKHPNVAQRATYSQLVSRGYERRQWTILFNLLSLEINANFRKWQRLFSRVNYGNCFVKLTPDADAPQWLFSANAVCELSKNNRPVIFIVRNKPFDSLHFRKISKQGMASVTKNQLFFERHCHATEKSEAIACARKCRSS